MNDYTSQPSEPISVLNAIKQVHPDKLNNGLTNHLICAWYAWILVKKTGPEAHNISVEIRVCINDMVLWHTMWLLWYAKV